MAADVLRTASLRHQKGLMAPQILHVLSTQEVRLPCLMEDEQNREFPSIHDIYQPLRQKVYAVIFNLHHLRYLHSKKKGKYYWYIISFLLWKNEKKVLIFKATLVCSRIC